MTGRGADVYVRQWNGSERLDRGSPSMGFPGVGSSTDPSMELDPSGRLGVGFRTRGSLADTYVRRWTGTTWEAVGDALTGDTRSGSVTSHIRAAGYVRPE